MKKTNKLKGFTLIELLVVLFIIGLLAALVIVNVNSSRKTSRDAKRISDLKTIQGALEMYNEKNGQYPSTCYNTTTNLYEPTKTCSSGSRFVCKNTDCGDNISVYDGQDPWIYGLVSGGFISVLPTDPKEGTDGCYIYKSNGMDYMVVAWKTVETCEPNDNCTTTNSVSLKEMARLLYTQPSIAVYTSGAASW